MDLEFLKKKRILLVDDEQELLKMVISILKEEGFQNIAAARTVREALELSGSFRPELAVLDVMLPDGDGFSLMEQLKQGGGYPILFLTARGEDEDKFRGFGLGADDYVTKPFSLAVLRARVNAQLRRRETEKQEAVRLDAFVFDFFNMKFWKDGTEIELSKTEQKLLKQLVMNPGITMERGMLVDKSWTDGAEYVDENALSVTIRRLRGKLEDVPGKPRYIKTVYGIGYVWAAGCAD